MARRQRLDLRLVELGLVSSRQQAQQLIRAGKAEMASALLARGGAAPGILVGLVPGNGITRQ